MVYFLVLWVYHKRAQEIIDCVAEEKTMDFKEYMRGALTAPEKDDTVEYFKYW